MFFNNPPKDYGKAPAVIDLKDITLSNDDYRVSVWTGNHLQVTVMNIKQNGDVGGEIHDHLDQMLYVLSGKAAVIMGKDQSDLSIKTFAGAGDAIFIPAGTWHNVINAGFFPLKAFSVYAPVQHPYGTVQKEKPNED